MKPKEIFDIIARAAGLVVILYGLGNLLYGTIGAMRLVETQAGRYNAISGVVQVIVGLMVMRGVIPVADIAYPPDTPQSDDAPTRVTETK